MLTNHGRSRSGVSYGALFSILVRMIEWSRKSGKYCSSAACTLCRPSRTLQPPLRRASPPSTGRRRRTLRRCHTRALLLRQTARSQGFRHRTRFLSGRSILLGWAYFTDTCRWAAEKLLDLSHTQILHIFVELSREVDLDVLPNMAIKNFVP